MSVQSIQRAWSSFHLKNIDQELREITGVASTPSIDRAGDTVVPEGAVYVLPLPLIWMHQHDAPIGQVEDVKVSKSGLGIVARIAKVTEPGRLKERCDEAWQCVTHQLVRGLSIGFKPLENGIEYVKGGVKYLCRELLEVSIVTIAANREAQIVSARNAAVSTPRTDPINLKPHMTPSVAGLRFTPEQRRWSTDILGLRKNVAYEQAVHALHFEIMAAHKVALVSEDFALAALRQRFVEVRAALRRCEVAEHTARRSVAAFLDLG